MIFPSHHSLSKHADSERWHNADEATKLQLTSLWGAPGEWNVSSVTNMNLSKREGCVFVSFALVIVVINFRGLHDKL